MMDLYAVFIKHTGVRWIDSIWVERERAEKRAGELGETVAHFGVSGLLIWIATLVLADGATDSPITKELDGDYCAELRDATT